MAGPGCIVPSQREQLEKNEYVKDFARFNGISPKIALDWIQSWQIKTNKDFIEESSKENNKWQVITEVTNNRQKEFQQRMKPTTQQFARRFNNLHKDLQSQQITDAIQLIEHLCYQLYHEYNKHGIERSIEEYLSKGEIGLYDEIYDALNYALTPDEDGDYVMHPLFVNEDYPDSDIVITKEQAQLLQKVLSVDNYDTLWHLFKINAKATLGVTIGQEKLPGLSLEEIGDQIEILDKGENDETTYFNYEESTKEAWQEVKEFIKPMKQLSKEVRRMFSHIPQYDKNGKIAISTFGVPRFESPHVIHRKVQSALLGVRDETDMIEMLKKQEAGYANDKVSGDKQIGYILKLIDSQYTFAQALEEADLSEDELDMQYESEYANSMSLRSKLFQDMQKSGMAYAVSKIRRKGREIWQSITFINTASSQLGNQLWQGYRSILAAKRNIISSADTLFDENGKLKQGAIATARSIAENLKIKSVDTETSKNYVKERTEDFFNQLSVDQQKARILAALRALGIPYNIDNINKLLRSGHIDKCKLVSNLYDVFNFIYGDGSRNPESSMLNALTVSTQGKWSASIAMSQVLRIANENNMMAQSVFRSSGSYMNPTKGFVEYQTAQLRGFLSDMFEDIQHAKEKTLAKDNIIVNGSTRTFKTNYVHKYIQEHFFQDPMFVEYEPQFDNDGNPILDKDNMPVKPKYKYHRPGYPVIRNPILDELWRSAENIDNMNSPNSFINQFKHYQFVGSEKDTSDPNARTSNADWKTWEDFNGMQHMSLLMNAYVQAYRSDEIGGTFKDSYADYPTFILGDSGKLKFIRSRRYRVRGKGDTVMKHLKEVIRQEIEFAKNQYDFQVGLVAQGQKPIKQMPLSKLMVQYPNDRIFYRIQSFPEINDLLYDKALENGVDFNQDQTVVAQKLGEILDGNLDEWLSTLMENRLTEFKEKCKKEGILTPHRVKRKINDTTTIEYDIYPNLPLGKDSGYAWKTDGTTESEMQNEAELNRFLEEFYYNSTLAMISQIQLVSLSPAFYKNSVEMQKRMKQIHANGKRPSLQAIDRYGKPYMIRNGKYDPNMDYILLNDVLGNPSQAQNEDFMNTVAYTHGRYTQEYYQFLRQNPEATSSQKRDEAIRIGKQSSQYRTFAATSYTDGQGYRTLEGYRKIKGALGEWSHQDENDYRRIKEIRRKHQDGSEWLEEEKIEVANMLSRWQPIKPFAYGMQEIQQITDGVGRKVRIPTQIKCSECLIIPELMPQGSKLRTIGEYLEDEFLDCAYYDSCIKVGAFGQAETQYVSNPDNEVHYIDGNIAEDSGIWKYPLEDRLKDGETFELMNNQQLDEVLNGQYPFMSPRRHSLSYSYYVEQNTVPEHTYNSRTIGTQLRKIFFDGLNQFELDEYGKPTGKIRSYKGYIDNPDGTITLPNGEIATLDSKEQLIKFYSSLHCANVLAQFDDILEIVKNDQTLSKELQKIAQRSSNEQLSKLVMYAVHQSLVDPKQKEFSLPLFENSLEHDAAATLISIFRKASTQLQIQGGSLVQASAYGIGKIRWIQSKNSYQEDNLQVVCDKKGNILYSECEVPFAQEYTDKFGKKQKLKFEDYCNEDGSLIQVEVVKKNENGEEVKVYVDKLERDFPGSTEMICYRIPSEKDYSAVVLRVKRFTKPVEGGIIRLPVQITSITGSDFDIDKMFLMRPQYVQKKEAVTLDEFISKTYKDEFLGAVWENVYSGNYFGTNGQSIKRALVKCQEDFMRRNGITDKQDKRVPTLNQFWDVALEENPNAFRGNKGRVFTDKQAFFEAAVQQVNPSFKEGTIKRFNKQQQYQWYAYDYSKPVDAQEKVEGLNGVKTDVVVRNNMMLHLVKKRLQDPQTMVSRTTPGGFKDAENAAKDIRYTVYADQSYIDGDEFNWDRFDELKDRPDPNESLNYADPFTLVEFNKQNQIAAKLVGTFANLNSFKQMLNSLEDARLAKRPIKMFGKVAQSLVRDDLGTNSTLFVAEMLAAAVDSVKNPTLKFLNITQSTAYVAGLMAMTGFTHREIGIFLNQPIVKEVTNYCEQNNCGLPTAIKAIIQQYYTVDGQSKAIEDENTYASKLTEGKLLAKLVGGEQVNSVESNKEDASFMNHQFSVLSALQHLTEASTALKSYVSASKMTSANSIQSTYGSLYHIQQAAENLNQIAEEDVQIVLFPYSSKTGVTSPINTELDTESPQYMDKLLDSVFPIEQVIYDVVKKFIDKTQQFFPYNNRVYKSTRDFFKNAKTSNRNEAVLMPKTIDAIHKYVQNWCLQNIPDCPTLFGGATVEVGSHKYPVRTYFLHVFPREFKKYLDAHAEQYPTLFRCLTVDENDRIILNYGFNRDSDKDQFTAEWRDLIQNNGRTISNRLNVGTALYFYNYHASRFNFGSTTFDHLMPQDQIPNIVVGYQQRFLTESNMMTLVPITYKDTLEYIKSNEFPDTDNEFKINFLRDNYNNNELVKQIYDYNQASYFGNSDITINTGNAKTKETFDFLKLRENNTDGTITYPLAVHVNNKIYIAVDQNGNLNNTVSIGDTIIYKVFSTESEDKAMKINEENMPIEGTFLEPASWDEIQSMPTSSIVYDLVDGLLNNMIETTQGDALDIHQYLDFCRDLIGDLKRQSVGVDNVYIVQESLKVLQKAYNAYSNGQPMPQEAIQQLKEANTITILRTFIDVICPGINKLTGEQRSDIYTMVMKNFVNDEGKIDIDNYTIEDIKVAVTDVLLVNRLEIENNIKAIRQSEQLFEVLKEDDGKSPLIPDRDKEVKPLCRG